ncbi:hypothetical protein MNBD_GAMMA18-2340 [hydrothermal vent metagenome]|uniref:Uncharacterized protein n=1 Tax=hydrothermal vent metagenome TaxID=652676 RepID=A0A3B0ZL02_9ZZZZ
MNSRHQVATHTISDLKTRGHLPWLLQIIMVCGKYQLTRVSHQHV